ncbi:uncharacterized protein [Diadema antillarum]|uniref:uncharacterized protein n=1 Tax=Diadema antillarum TaxID=105358 RepID=UPI003A891E16
MEDLASQFRRIARKSRGAREVGDLKEIVRIRKQSRIRTLVLDHIKEDDILIKGREELLLGIRELRKQLEWLRGNKRARQEARRIYRWRTFFLKVAALETFCIHTTVLIVVLFASVHIFRAISIILLPELFLECSAAHAYVYALNGSLHRGALYSGGHDATSPLSGTPLSALHLRWLLLQGKHPCVPIYMECFDLPTLISHPYHGQR